MLQPNVGDENGYHLGEEWRVVEHVRRWYFNRFELVTKDSLQQAQDHLNRAVKNGKIGQNPYNDEEKLKISDAFLLFLAEKFRNVGEADSAREIFENMYPKNPDDAIILTSDFNTFEVDTDLEIALKIAKPYRDIARPIVAWILSEYQNAFKKGENEAKRKLKMTDKFDLDLIVHLFDTEIKAKCEEIDFGITEKILEKTRANPGRRLADESGDDRLIGSALPIRAVEATSSPSSIQRNVLATIHPKECQSNCAAQHPFAQVSSSSSAVSGQQDGINVATNNQSTPDYVITAPSLTSSSSIVETNSSGQTVEAARSSKRPRLNVGSYSAYFDDESENLRQIEKSLYALDSDESYEESPVSRPSTSMKSRNYGVRYNYQERVNDLLGQGIKVSGAEIAYYN